MAAWLHLAVVADCCTRRLPWYERGLALKIKMLVYYKMDYKELLDKISSLRAYVQNLIDCLESDHPMLDTIIEVVLQLEQSLLYDLHTFVSQQH